MPSYLQRRCNWFALIGLGCAAVALAGRVWPGWLSAGINGFLCGIAVAAIALWLVVRLMPQWWREVIDEELHSEANVLYRRQMWIGMSLYVGAILLSTWWIHRGIPSVALRAVVAVLPAFGLAWVTLAMVRYVRRVDELKRRIELESFAIAGLLVAQLYLVGGLLQQAKVIAVPAGEAMLWVFPCLLVGYAVAKFFVRRHYR